MADTFKLEIVTPEKKVVDTAAEEVQIPGKNGYLGVLPGHAPLITELAVGEIKYCENSHELVLAVAWGFAEVLPDKVTILASPRLADKLFARLLSYGRPQATDEEVIEAESSVPRSLKQPTTNWRPSVIPSPTTCAHH